MPVDVQAVRDKTPVELEAEVKDLREQLFKLRWQSSMGQIENPNKIRAVRKAIARNLTVLGEKSRAGRGDAR
jgi:large subunit ribosomal protein L29